MKGCYIDEDTSNEVIFIERDRDMPWSFGITGALREQKGKNRDSYTEFWKEVFNYYYLKT